METETSQPEMPISRGRALLAFLESKGIHQTRSTGLRPPYTTPPPVTTSARERRTRRERAIDRAEPLGREILLRKAQQRGLLGQLLEKF